MIYNVWEAGVLYTSYAVTGMQPQWTAVDQCLPQMASSACYVLYMTRSDAQQLYAYMPYAGGVDLQYTVVTSGALNALGATQRLYSPDGSVLYSLTGTCFSAQSLRTTRSGKRPPLVTLGNACALLAQQVPLPSLPNAARMTYV